MIRIYFFQKQEKERQTLRFGNWLLKPKKKDADCCTITDDALSEKREKNKFLRKKLNIKKEKEKKKKDAWDLRPLA